ncbi:MAG: zinc ribbon domain-containing protein [Hyphomonas sp.]|nr:zinc ribbon domain-containing protein [Hyphomonas sp.]
MPETVRLQCLNCGERFEKLVLTDREKRELREQNIPFSAVHCPKCARTDTRRGWS